MSMRQVFLMVLLTLGCATALVLFSSATPNDSVLSSATNPGKLHSTPWVDSVFASLTLEERIAQLLMIRVHTDRDQEYYDSIVRTVSQYNIGGAAFFRGGPHRQLLLTNRIQSQAKTPLLIAMDAEWGPAMRLDSIDAFPRQLTLGALQDDDLIYQMGVETGRQLTRLGVHINFAPVADVNNNPRNPVINSRSFGEDRENVAKKAVAYMHGMQDAGIIACGKHFPGHGDTDADSHYTLPLLRHSFNEIDSIHLYPFKRLIEQGLQSVMTAHLEIPSLEAEPNLASTLSANIVTNVLQIQLGFDGLVITDALDMQGVSDYFDSGELELRALMAGNDILLLPENIPAAIDAIKDAIADGTISEELVNARCKKILYYKQKARLDDFHYFLTDNLIEDMQPTHARVLNKQLASGSLTLVRNEDDLLPLTDLGGKNMAALAIGATPDNVFHSFLNRYAPLSTHGIDKYHSPQRAKQVIGKLKNHDLVIISVHDNSFLAQRDYGINGKTISLIHAIALETDVILTLFANPYSLALFGDKILDVDAVLLAYQEGETFEQAAAEAVFGGLQVRGSLPVTSGDHFPLAAGIITPEPSRVRFGMAEEAGIRSALLSKIDTLALRGIKQGAYPGCQIAVIRNGVMIYNKTFGHHAYDSIMAVGDSDIYDLASITKVAATTPVIMHLAERGTICIDKPVATYLPWLSQSDKGAITIRSLMAHQAGFAPWIPFYRETLDDGTYLDGLYQSRQTDAFPVKVAYGMFLHKNYRDTIMQRIAASDLLEGKEYRYSDLGFILLADIIREVTGEPLDALADSILYAPMGLSTMGFNPLERFERTRIVPTENDTTWRRQTVHGTVHDPAAAMLGGVSGHAGLFSNAADLAILMHMLLNDGHYGGSIFFDGETIRHFTSTQFAENDNRRGLGFDKPPPDAREIQSTAPSASPLSFGHSGFTGTYVWVDPLEDLVYVFLSNRTYPTQSNRKLIDKNTRTRILQAIYNAIYQSSFLEHFTTENTNHNK